MLSSIKRILILLAIVTIGALAGIYFYSKGRTYYNDASEIGNTTGNIYNGGLFCEQDNTIFFSNDEDNGRLYRMKSDCTDIKKVSEDSAAYINVDENYIYYARANDITQYNSDFYSFYHNNGIYRINYNGKNLKAITSDPGAFLMLKGNYLFFLRYSVQNNFTLTRFKIDGTMERTLSHNSSVPFEYTNNYLYYTGDSKGNDINSMELSSYTEHTYYNGSFIYPIFMGNYLYYLNPADENKLYRMKKDGSNPEVIVNKPCSAYNITNSGKYLYYQINGTEKDRLRRINLETMKIETVMKGIYKAISVTSKYVFFKTPDSSTTYRIDADGAVHVDVFYTSQQLSPTPSVTAGVTSGAAASVTSAVTPGVTAAASPTPTGTP